jgi:hypothetical protein
MQSYCFCFDIYSALSLLCRVFLRAYDDHLFGLIGFFQSLFFLLCMYRDPQARSMHFQSDSFS